MTQDAFKDVKPKALRKKATTGVAWSFLRQGISEVLLFPASMVLARLLTPQEFGIAAAANFFSQLAGRLSDLGFNAALVRSKEIRPIHLSTVFVVSLALGVVKFSALFLAAPFVNAFYGVDAPGNVIRVAAFAFLIGPFGGVPGALLSRNFQYKKAAMVDTVNLVVFSFTSVILAWLGFSYMSMVYGRLAGATATVVTRIVFARWRPSLRFSWPVLREILSFGSGFHAKRLLDYVAQQGDNLIVGKLQGMTALGLYDKAFSTMDRFLTRMTGGPGVMFRIFAVIHEDQDRFRRAYQKMIMSSSLLGFPVFAVLIVTAPELIVVLFGSQWEGSVQPFRLLCVAATLKLLNTYASSVIQATGRVWAEVWRQMVLIALTVGGVAAFNAWGPTGAAAGVLLATIAMSVMMHALLRRVGNLRWSEIVRPLMPALSCATAVAAMALLAGRAVLAFHPGARPVLLLVCQVAPAAVLGVVFVLFAPFPELRTVVRDVTKDLAPSFVSRQPWAQAYWKKSLEETEKLSV